MMNYDCHESAIIDPGAVVGSGTRIWHFAHISSSCTIGENCVLGQNVYVGPNCRIGSGVKIQNNVSIYEGVELEKDVFCGPSVVFTNMNKPRAFLDGRGSFKSTIVKRGATLGANATVLCGVTVGQYALIGAGATVTKDVPGFAMVLGTPGRVVGWVSRHGEVLDFPCDGSGAARCPITGESYVLSDGHCFPGANSDY